MRTGVLFVVAVLSTAECYAQLGTPKAATVRYQNGVVHDVLGMNGNYVVNAGTLTGITAASFSDRFGFVSTGAALQLLESSGQIIATYDTVEPRAVLDVKESEETAIGWLPSHSALVYRVGHEFVLLPIPDLPGQSSVMSISKRDEKTASLVTTEPDGATARVTINLKSGAIEEVTYVTRGSQAAHEFGRDIVLFSEGRLQVILGDTGAPLFEGQLPATNVRFEQASSNSLQVFSLTDSRNWLLYSNKGGFGVAELPPAGHGR
jgi:hypothetical protein